MLTTKKITLQQLTDSYTALALRKSVLLADYRYRIRQLYRQSTAAPGEASATEQHNPYGLKP
jgi:hypothetical protein